MEYVTAGRTQAVPAPATPDELVERCAETVRAGVAQMRGLLADPGQTRPLRKDAFERREGDLHPTCTFAPVCA